MNAIFAVEVRQESDFARFAFHSATPLSFLSGEPRPIFFRHDSETFLHRCEIAKLAARLPRRGPEGRIYPSGVECAFRPFFSHFIPFPLLCSTPTPLYFLGFPLSFSISSIYGNVNRRNGLIGFISRSRCPQFQFSRACVFSVSVEIRSVYSG